jgi:hypothetical protein
MLKKEHDRLTTQIEGISAALAAFGAVHKNGTGTRPKISAAGKAWVAAAQKARGAKPKAKNGRPNVVAMTEKRTNVGSRPKEDCSGPKAEMGEGKPPSNIHSIREENPDTRFTCRFKNLPASPPSTCWFSHSLHRDFLESFRCLHLQVGAPMTTKKIGQEPLRENRPSPAAGPAR